MADGVQFNNLTAVQENEDTKQMLIVIFLVQIRVIQQVKESGAAS